MAKPGSGMSLMFKALPLAHKRMLAVLVVAGGITVGHRVKYMVKDAQRKQKALCAEVQAVRNSGSRKPAPISVNKQFLKRLLAILSICVPSPFSKEAGLILIQGILLVSRTLLTDLISRIEGWSGGSLVSQKFDEFWQSLFMFGLVGIPAALINSALKYMQKQLELAFQSRLTEHLHKQYCSNRAYYAAATLGGMVNPDQRITEDVEKFCFSVSDLYSHTFKPLLDVILFTRSLATTMGYKGQFGLYLYYIGVAWLLRAISPPLAQMTAQETALSGGFRAAHQRLVTHSEEIAFNDPPAGCSEQLILNQHLRRLLRYSGLSALQRGVQQVADGYFIKYFASVTSLLVYALPLYFKPAHLRPNQEVLTQDYIRSMRLLQNTARGVGDLILVYKRVAALASHTSRVAELLEQVTALSGEDAEHRELFRRNVSATHMLGVSSALFSDSVESPPAPRRLQGDHINFYRVALDSPDGAPLFRELTLEVTPGHSVLLMGPNGCGKSSLFRVMAGLWPLQAGEVTTPEKTKLFYLSQRPYLVTGTLRDQLLYPFPPRAVWMAASTRERAQFSALAGQEPPATLTAALDERLSLCLKAVELEYLVGRKAGFDQVQNWLETLSGGEKQRLAVARLLFHRPVFAVLDECTSAVSADGELRLYQELQAAGITFLSIAHRPALKRFHKAIVHFDANVAGNGLGWWSEDLQPEAPSRSASAPDGGVHAPEDEGSRDLAALRRSVMPYSPVSSPPLSSAGGSEEAPAGGVKEEAPGTPTRGQGQAVPRPLGLAALMNGGSSSRLLHTGGSPSKLTPAAGGSSARLTQATPASAVTPPADP